MDENPILETEKHTGEAIFYFFLSIIPFSGCCFFMYSGLTRGEYPQLPAIFFGVVLGFAAVLIFISNYRLNTLKLYEDRLEIVSVFGNIKKTIWRDAITSWSEYVFKNGTKYLMIFTDKDKYRIKNTDFGDYDFLRETIIQGKPQIAAQLNKTPLFLAGLLFMIMSLFILGIPFHDYLVKDDKINPREIITIAGIILNGPQTFHGRGADGSFIRIKLNEYQDFVFDVGHAAYRGANRRDYFVNVKRGDSLYLDILTDDYQKKLAKEKPLGFFDKTVNYEGIDVYGFRDSHTSYLTLDDYNNTDKLTSDFYMESMIGLIFLVMSAMMIRAVYRQKSR